MDEDFDVLELASMLVGYVLPHGSRDEYARREQQRIVLSALSEYEVFQSDPTKARNALVEFLTDNPFRLHPGQIRYILEFFHLPFGEPQEWSLHADLNVISMSNTYPPEGILEAYIQATKDQFCGFMLSHGFDIVMD